MHRRTSTGPGTVAALLITAVFGACTGPDRQFEEARKKVDGLTATTHAIGEAWLSGDVSILYTRTAFRQTLELLDKERAALNTSPGLLVEARGAALSRDAEQLSRALAALIHDAQSNDGVSGRQHLSQVPAAGTSP